MRRTNLIRTTSALLTASMIISMTACSAKPSTDTVETSTEVVTEEETIETSDNDVSSNDVTEPSTEEETLTESKEEESTEAETEESPESTSSPDESETEEEEEAVTPSKTSEKDSTKSETTTSETTTEAVTVQSVSAVVSGTHYVGETLTGADFTVTVTFANGETLTNPDGWSAQPLTLSSTSNLITVAYEGASVTITVNAENVPETTVLVAEVTTAAATTVAQVETTAATQVETTVAETTTVSNEETITIEAGSWSYEFALMLFDAQNELRTEAGLDPFIWDDSLYEVAKQCAKVCGDTGGLNHDLTKTYRSNVLRTTADGRTLSVTYMENLQGAGSYEDNAAVSLYKSYATNLLGQIKASSGHYRWIISEKEQYSAIAVYKHNDGSNNLTISYIFYEGDECYDGSYYSVEDDMWVVYDEETWLKNNS